MGKKSKTGWYVNETSTDKYYTNEVATKREYIHHGEGNSMPTPKELKELLEANPEGFLEDFTGLVRVYDAKGTVKKPVELPSGCYTHQPGSHSGSPPERLVPTELRKDSYIKMESIYNPLVDDIKAFLANEAIYRQIGTIYKRGLLLYGPPGEGKTSLIRCLAKNELPADAVVIFFEVMPSPSFIEHLKLTLSTRMKFFIFEELANMIENARLERVLDFLDGEKSIDKTCMIATTNYPERLPGNIVERPSRFDKLYKMGHPKSSERKLLLTHYLTRIPTDEEVKMTEGLSTAALKECCFLIHLRGMTMELATKALKKHSELVKSDFADPKKQMGLGRNTDDDDF